MANEVKSVYSATTTTVISHAATLANAANTYSGLSGCTMTQLDNSSEMYPDALLVLHVPDTFAAAPTAGGTVDVYMTLDDVDSTNDETPLPGATDILYLARYVGSFVMDNQDLATRKAIVVRDCLHGVAKAQFYIYNNCGQTLSYSSGAITLKVTPLTQKPA
jgi:hypothetical protein